MYATFKGIMGNDDITDCNRYCYAGRAAIDPYLKALIDDEQALYNLLMTLGYYAVNYQKLSATDIHNWIKRMSEVIAAVEAFMERNEFTIAMMDYTRDVQRSHNAFVAAYVKLTNMTRVFSDLNGEKV